MTNRIKLTIGFLAAAIFATLLLLINVNSVRAYITSDITVPTDTYRTYQFFASSTAPTTVATSTVGFATSTSIIAWNDTSGRVDNGAFVIAGAKRVEIYFSRGGVTHANTGSSIFTIQESPDGVNWYAVSKLVQSTSTSISAAGEVGTWMLTGTSTVTLALDTFYDDYYSLRCVVNNVTDGEAGCLAAATF